MQSLSNLWKIGLFAISALLLSLTCIRIPTDYFVRDHTVVFSPMGAGRRLLIHEIKTTSLVNYRVKAVYIDGQEIPDFDVTHESDSISIIRFHIGSGERERQEGAEKTPTEYRTNSKIRVWLLDSNGKRPMFVDTRARLKSGDQSEYR